MRSTKSIKIAATRLGNYLASHGVTPSTGPSWRPWKGWAERFDWWYGQARAYPQYGGLGMRPDEVAGVVRYDGTADRNGRREKHVLGVMAGFQALRGRKK